MVKMVPEQDDEEFFLVEEDDCFDDPAKKNEKPVKKKSELVAESNSDQHFKTMPTKKQNVFLIDDSSPLVDDNFRQKQILLNTPEKLDTSTEVIKPFEVEGPVEARNFESEIYGSDDEYDKYLDQLESAGDLESSL
jgi:hypothetical protein